MPQENYHLHLKGVVETFCKNEQRINAEYTLSIRPNIIVLHYTFIYDAKIIFLYYPLRRAYSDTTQLIRLYIDPLNMHIHI